MGTGRDSALVELEPFITKYFVYGCESVIVPELGMKENAE